MSCYSNDNISNQTDVVSVGTGTPIYNGNNNPIEIRSIDGDGIIDVYLDNDTIFVNLDVISNGGGESLISSTTQGELALKSIVAGDNINITSNADEIIIESIPSEYTDTGVGISLFNIATTNGQLFQKTLIGGNLLSLDDNGDDITFNVDIQFQNLGTGFPIYDDTTEASFRTLIGGNNITIVDTGDELVLNGDLNAVLFSNIGVGSEVYNSASPAGTAEFRRITDGGVIDVNQLANEVEVTLDVNSVGTGESLINSTSSGLVELRSLVGGTDIAVVDNGTEIVFNSTATGLTLSNIGVGSEVYNDASPVGTAEFRRITDGGVIEVNQLVNEVEVTLDVISTGTGESIINSTSSGLVELRSLVGGADITVIDNGDELIINNIAATTNFSNIGVGSEVYNSASPVGTAEFRRITDGGVIDVNQLANEVEVTLDVNSVGTGESLINSTSSGLVELRSIEGLNVIDVTNNGDTTEVDLNVVSTGTGESVINSTASGLVELKSLVGGSDINIVDNGNELIINSASTGLVFSNIGTGSEVYNNASPVGTAEFRRITDGGVIDVNQLANEVEVTLDVNSVGTGESLINSTSSGLVELRSIEGLNVIDVTNNGDTTEVDLSVVSTGTGESLINSTSSGLVELKSLVSGTDINIVNNGNELVINSTATGLALSNIGTGSEVYNDASPVGTAEFRRINGLNLIDSTQNGNTIELDLQASTSGSGTTLINSATSGSLELRSLIGGTNVTIDSSAGALTINATGTSTLFENIGTGAPVYNDASPVGTAQFRRFNQGGVMSVQQSGNSILTSLNVSSLGVGQSIIGGTSPGLINYRSFAPGLNTEVVTTPTTIRYDYVHFSNEARMAVDFVNVATLYTGGTISNRINLINSTLIAYTTYNTGILNLATNIFTPPFTGRYSLNLSITATITAIPPNTTGGWNFLFREVTSGSVVNRIDTLPERSANTYSSSSNVTLFAGVNYEWFYIFNATFPSGTISTIDIVRGYAEVRQIH